jgi:thymidine phosphorylase
MSQPLGDAIGNALDVIETVELLRGGMRGRLRDAAVMFAGEALSRLTGVGMGEGRASAAAAIDDGRALESFRAMIAAQGGDPRVVDEPERVLPRAAVRRPIVADRAGTLSVVDAEALGRASGDLGAGRKRKGDPIDPSVGIVYRPKIGDRIEVGQEIGEVRAQSEDDANGCIARVLAAATLVEGEVEPPPLVYDWYGG